MKQKDDMSLGQLLDELADKYFAAGLDGFSANAKALSDVSEAFFNLSKILLRGAADED